MAYDKKKIYEQAKEAIVKHNLFFIEDIIAFVPCGRSWFYENFKDGTDEMDNLKQLLEDNRIKTKSSIRAKLYKSQKAAELLALYKLICTDDERKKLSMQYNETQLKGELNQIVIERKIIKSNEG